MVLTNNISNKQTPGGRTLPGVVFILICIFAIAAAPAFAQTATPSATLVPTAALSPTPADTTTVTPTASETPTPTAPELSPSPAPAISSINLDFRASTVSTSSAVLNTVTVANTVSQGGNPQIINYTRPTTGTIDLSQSAPCTASNSAMLSSLINNAVISNTIDVASVTGDKTAGSATANVFNMANTTLSGSCWNFQVVNFFAPHNGDVGLPAVDRYFHPSASTMTPVSANVTNTATVNNTLSAAANTGNVSSVTMQTGDATVQVRSQELLNTTIGGNNWVFLTIRSYGGWQGSLLNWPGQIIQTPGYTYAFLPPSPAHSAGGFPIVNTATVTNNISAIADTGNTDASGGLATNPASATINLFDMLNTTLLGNNWYFAYITLFDSFNGSFVFPAPPAVAKTEASLSPSPATISNHAASFITGVEAQDIPATAVPTAAFSVLSSASYSPLLPTSPPLQKPVFRTGRTIRTAFPSNAGSEQNAGLFLSLLGILSAIIKSYLLLRKTTG